MTEVDQWLPGLTPAAGPAGSGDAAGATDDDAAGEGRWADTDRIAIDWAGERLSFAELASAIERVDVRGPVDVTALALPDQLVGVFAAAAARVPVLIADPTNPLPPLASWRHALPADVFLVVATSGSTGSPRAVLRTLASWTSSFDGYTAFTGMSGASRLLLTGPLSSTLQLFAAVHACWLGASITDDPATATAAICVPAVLPRLLATPRPPLLRQVVVAGDRLPDCVARQALSAGLTVSEYYGAAELSFVAARSWPDRWQPFPGVELRVRGGELWSRSAYHALGYLGSDGALRTDADGFATVGDLGTIGAAGDLQILGRGDTAVTVGGRTVAVQDIEAALAGIPGVLEAAALGVPHSRLGQQLAAVVVLSATAELACVRSTARTLLRGEALPRSWRQAATLPRTSAGKIDRAALGSLYGSVG